MGIFNLFSKKTLKSIPLNDFVFDGSNGKDFVNKYISEHMGGYICKVINDSRPAYSKEQTTLKNYFEKFKGYSTLTLDKFDSKRPPLFFNDVEIPNPFFKKNDIERFFFYHSVENAGTLPHIHGDAFNVLQKGVKQWVFYDASPSLNPLGYNLLQESNRKYPVGTHAKNWFKKALPVIGKSGVKVYSCVQEEGDIVYIPNEYCHAVLNKSEVMGIVFETSRR